MRALRRPGPSFSIPLRISPKVSTLTNRVCGAAASNHSLTAAQVLA